MKQLFQILFSLSLIFMIGCEGAEGIMGESGTDGINTLVTTATEPIGANCANGGIKVSFGSDTDGDGVLSATEVTNETYICNGDDGDDGVANVSTSIIQMDEGNTQYEGDSDDGYLYYEFSSNLITNDVLENGVVLVEMSPTTPYDWAPLPLVLYDGDNSGVAFMYDAFYHYSVGKVTIMWSCSFDRSASDWMGIMWLWANYYKISIITPT